MPGLRDTAKTLALATAATAVAVALATPVCLAILGVDGCESFACEFMAMRRPHADLAWCEAFFDLFR